MLFIIIWFVCSWHKFFGNLTYLLKKKKKMSNSQMIYGDVPINMLNFNSYNSFIKLPEGMGYCIQPVFRHTHINYIVCQSLFCW